VITLPVDPNEKKLLGAQVPIQVHEDFKKVAEEEGRTMAGQLLWVVKEFLRNYKNKSNK
jgi:hypothetical protein